MSRKRPLPRRGDKTLDSRFLAELAGGMDWTRKLSISGGELSMGPSGTGIVIPEVPEPELLKIIHHDMLPAAHGGYAGAGRWNVGPEAIALGNFVESNSEGTGTNDRRKMFIRTCPQWEFKDAPGGYGLENDGQGNCYLSRPASTGLAVPNLQVMSPFDLPVRKGMGLVYPVNPSEPDKLQYMLIQPLTSNPWGAVNIKWQANSVTEGRVYIRNSGSYTGPGDFGDGKLLTNFLAQEGYELENGSDNWLHKYHSDIILNYPGTYKITFGISAVMLPRAVTNYGTELNGGLVSAHSHLYQQTAAGWLGVEILKNKEEGVGMFNPSEKSETNDFLLKLPMSPTSNHVIYMDGFRAVGEKTIIVQNDRYATHGGDWTRLSVCVGFHVHEAFWQGGNTTNVYCDINDFWMTVEPVPSLHGFFGGGANVYPTGYSQGNNSLFKWWGAGPIPYRQDYLGNSF